MELGLIRVYLTTNDQVADLLVKKKGKGKAPDASTICFYYELNDHKSMTRSLLLARKRQCVCSV